MNSTDSKLAINKEGWTLYARQSALSASRPAWQPPTESTETLPASHAASIGASV